MKENKEVLNKFKELCEQAGTIDYFDNKNSTSGKLYQIHKRTIDGILYIKSDSIVEVMAEVLIEYLGDLSDRKENKKFPSNTLKIIDLAKDIFKIMSDKSSDITTFFSNQDLALMFIIGNYKLSVMRIGLEENLKETKQPNQPKTDSKPYEEGFTITKKYTVTVTEQAGEYKMELTNDGFSPWELLGIVEHTKENLLLQIKGDIEPDIVERKVVDTKSKD